MTEEDLKLILTNPLYISQNGVGDFLVKLLENLKGNYVDNNGIVDGYIDNEVKWLL